MTANFQSAVFKMHGFFCCLRPELVFQRFRGIPSPDEYDLCTRNARCNLQIGRK
jgi:hypothetical protein